MSSSSCHCPVMYILRPAGGSHTSLLSSAHHVSWWMKHAAEIIFVELFFSFLSFQCLSHISAPRDLSDYNLHRQLNILISNYCNYYRRFRQEENLILCSCHINHRETLAFILTNSIIKQTVNEVFRGSWSRKFSTSCLPPSPADNMELHKLQQLDSPRTLSVDLPAHYP